MVAMRSLTEIWKVVGVVGILIQTWSAWNLELSLPPAYHRESCPERLNDFSRPQGCVDV
jgi:hypothetical protein